MSFKRSNLSSNFIYNIIHSKILFSNVFKRNIYSIICCVVVGVCVIERFSFQSKWWKTGCEFHALHFSAILSARVKRPLIVFRSHFHVERGTSFFFRAFHSFSRHSRLPALQIRRWKLDASEKLCAFARSSAVFLWRKLLALCRLTYEVLHVYVHKDVCIKSVCIFFCFV